MRDFRRGALAATLSVCAAIGSGPGAAADRVRLIPVQVTIPMPGETVAERVRRTLGGDANFSAIRVQENRGIVTLTGTVPTAHAAERAQRLISALNGVDCIDNRLTVGPAGPEEGLAGPPGAMGVPGVARVPGTAGSSTPSVAPCGTGTTP